MRQRIDVPLACSLSSAEFREREATLLNRFRCCVLATDELSDGFAFRMTGDTQTMTILWELMIAERACCPFMSFEVVAPANMGPVLVRITGPAGSKAVLRAIFLDKEERVCKPL